MNLVFPAAESKSALRDSDCSPRRHLGQKILDDPFDRFLALPAIGIKPLVKVAFAMQERHCDHWHLKVGGSSNRVAGENAEAAAIGRDLGSDAYFHREIGDFPGRAIVSRGHAARWR